MAAQRKKKKTKGTAKTKTQSISPISQKSWRAGIAIIVAVGLIIRLLNINAVYHSDLKNVHANNQFDSHFFDNWAKKINKGDLLTDRALHPYHDWHEAVASYAITDDKIVQDKDKLRKKGKSIWKKWYGKKQFHQEPFYPYFLAGVYGIFGHKPYLIFVLQAIFSMISLLLLIMLTKDLFDKRTGLVAGSLFALFGPAVFYDSILLRASLITLATLALLYAAHRLIMGKDGKWPWFFGLAIGFNLLLKFSSIITVLLLIGFITYQLRSDKKYMLVSLAKVTGAALLVLSPLVIRNVVVGASPFSFSSVGAITYINSNFPEYDVYSGFMVDFEGSARIMKASNAKLSKVIPLSIEAFDGFGSFVGLQFKKLGTVFHEFEIPNNFNFYRYKIDSIWLRIAGVRFYMIFGFGLLGMVLAARKKHQINVIHWALIAQLIVLVGFYVLSRFKLSFTICLIPFAAFATMEIIQWITNKQFKKLLWLGVPIAAALFTLRPIADSSTYLRPVDMELPFSTQATKRLDKAANENDLDKIVSIYNEYASTLPPVFLEFNATNPPETFKEIELSEFYQSLFSALDGFYGELGRVKDQNEARKISNNLSLALNAIK